MDTFTVSQKLSRATKGKELYSFQTEIFVPAITFLLEDCRVAGQRG